MSSLSCHQWHVISDMSSVKWWNMHFKDACLISQRVLFNEIFSFWVYYHHETVPGTHTVLRRHTAISYFVIMQVKCLCSTKVIIGCPSVTQLVTNKKRFVISFNYQFFKVTNKLWEPFKKVMMTPKNNINGNVSKPVNNYNFLLTIVNTIMMTNLSTWVSFKYVRNYKSHDIKNFLSPLAVFSNY